jgi:DNA-binding LacI/PurR family transcriptional regulator
LHTRKDVAEHAGVSKTTVSRVLNNSGYVSPENREKIENAIRELGYRPNLIARSLKTKETRQFLFQAPELSNPFYMEVYKGMEEYAEEHNYTIVVSSRYDRDIVHQRQFDGVILSGIQPEHEKDLKALKIPVVVTSYTRVSLPFPSVGIDIEEGALAAMRHLIAKGHREIAFLTNGDTQKDDRYKGYAKGLEAGGIPLQQQLLVSSPGPGAAYEKGFRLAEKLMGTNVRFTAVYAFNDAIAIGAMSAFYQRGYRIPDSLSLIGFDDILQSRFTCPPLTTIYMPKYEQGWESARLLLKTIQGEAVESLTLQTRLVERGSVTERG